MGKAQGPARIQLAAGALVWRERGGELEVLLVHRPRYKDWSWPKGKLEPGESLAQCAMREVAEETGRHVILGRPLPMISYRLAGGTMKEVHYWAARKARRRDAAAGAAQGDIPRASRKEVDKVAWVSAVSALRVLTRVSDARPLRALVHAHLSGALETEPLVVLRHARARTRQAWDGPEATRPLTRTGQQRAGALVPVLAAYGVGQLISSPWQRCIQTLAPYAAASGLPVDKLAVLTEAEAGTGAVSALIGELIDKGPAAAVCTHRPVLPELMAALGGHLRNGLAGSLPGQDPYLRTGEALIAQVGHGVLTGKGRNVKPKTRIVSLERLRPPL